MFGGARPQGQINVINTPNTPPPLPLMPQSTLSGFTTSAPPNIDPEASTELQYTNGFASNTTATSTQDLPVATTGLLDCDLDRIRGYTELRDEKVLHSYVWAFGYRVQDRKQREHWICRICHTGPLKPRKPTGHCFYAGSGTSKAIQHLKSVHRVTKATDPVISIDEARNLAGSIQQSISSFPTATPKEFDFEVFKGLILQLFTTEQVPFSLIDAKAFRALLVYLQPLLSDCIPTRTTLRRHITKAYNQALTNVESELHRATSRINLSFDLWTSPGRRLALLGVVAHYLDATYIPRAVLLSLPAVKGAHTAANVASSLSAILRHFKLHQSFGHAITDNASENEACMNILSAELAIPRGKRHVFCIGHIINLVAHQLLFGEDPESFEESLITVTAEEVELRNWRRRGPIGKLHNLIRYINHSTQRRDAFAQAQRDRPDALRGERLQSQETYELIRDNLTRWNSWHDAAQRALDLRPAVDDFTDNELHDYDQKLARHNRRPATESAPKAPSLINDRLNDDDWHVIARYVELLKPLKRATMNLQGNVNTTAKQEQPIKGAIWQVLPAFEEILQGLEHAREQHRPLASQQLSQQPRGSPLSASAGNKRRRTQRSSPERAATPPTISGGSGNNTNDTVQSPLPSVEYLELQLHFSANINRGWQKLDKYYNKTDVTPIHRAAVLLHPRLKWRWFERYWKHKPKWIADARAAIDELWIQYKHQSITGDPIAPATVIQDEWSEFDSQEQPSKDQLLQYTEERESADISAFDSPLPFWIHKRRQWPQLAQMAFDIYSTPAMSDEPERVFSIAGNTMNPRRRRLTSDAVQQLLCLRSWQRSEVITLDTRLIRQAVLPTSTGDSDGNGDDEGGDEGGDDGSDDDSLLRDDGELLYHEQTYE